MVIKGAARSGPEALARHLLRTDHNERVTIRELGGVTAETLPNALREMHAMAEMSRSSRTLYHAQINTAPGKVLTDAQKSRAIERLEQEMGMEGQPRAVVEHVKRRKGQERAEEHMHVVWLRIDTASGIAIHDGHNYRKHEQVARELEREFGHEHVRGVHIEREGRERPTRTPSHAEMQQAQRTGRTVEEDKRTLTEIWQQTRTGQAFIAELEHTGWRLAHGDRKGTLMVVDREGEAFSLVRRLDGYRIAAVRERMADVDIDRLPSVAEARRLQRERSRDIEHAPSPEKQPEFTSAEIDHTPSFADLERMWAESEQHYEPDGIPQAQKSACGSSDTFSASLPHSQPSELDRRLERIRQRLEGRNELLAPGREDAAESLRALKERSDQVRAEARADRELQRELRQLERDYLRVQLTGQPIPTREGMAAGNGAVLKFNPERLEPAAPEITPGDGAVLKFRPEEPVRTLPDDPVEQEPYSPPDIAPLWMRESKGYLGLSDELKRAAEGHFRAWLEKRQNQQEQEPEGSGGGFDITAYVAFAQEQEGFRAEQRAEAAEFRRKREGEEHDFHEDPDDHNPIVSEIVSEREPTRQIEIPAPVPRVETEGEIWQRERDEALRLEQQHRQAERARVVPEPIRVAAIVEKTAQSVFDVTTLKPFRRPVLRMIDRLASFVSDLFDDLFAGKAEAAPRPTPEPVAMKALPLPEPVQEAPPPALPRRSIVDDMLDEARLQQAKRGLDHMLEDYKGPHEHEMEIRRRRRLERD